MHAAGSALLRMAPAANFKGEIDDDAALGLLVVQACGLGTVSREIPGLAAYPALTGFVSAAALWMPVSSMGPRARPVNIPDLMLRSASCRTPRCR